MTEAHDPRWFAVLRRVDAQPLVVGRDTIRAPLLYVLHWAAADHLHEQRDRAPTAVVMKGHVEPTANLELVSESVRAGLDIGALLRLEHTGEMTFLELVSDAESRVLGSRIDAQVTYYVRPDQLYGAPALFAEK